ncbi:hypothetical protein ACVBEG_16960 [Pseudomonas sp. GG8]
MTTSPFAVPSDLVIKNLKRVAQHWGFVSVILGVLGTIFGIGTLYTYFQAIGLPELLPLALDTKTSLIPWMIVVGILFVMYVVGLIVTSAAYAWVVATFNKQPSYQPLMAVLLTIPALAGITVLIVAIFQFQEYGTPWKLLASGITVFAVTLLLMKFQKFKMAIDVTALMAHPTTKIGWQRRAAVLFTVTGILCGTVFIAVLPVLLLLMTYQGPEDNAALYKLTWMSIAAAGVTLIPAMAFFISQDSLPTRLRNTFVGLVLMIVAMLSFAPATLPIIVYRAALMMGVRSNQTASYMITDTYASEDFDARWGTVTTLRGHPVVEGFPLFTVGSLILLCPANLVETKLQHWPEFSQACLVTDTKTAKRMPTKTTAKSGMASESPSPSP